MKFLSFSFAFALTFLITSSMSEQSLKFATHQETNTSLIAIINATLNDSEFVSLDLNQQLRILKAMYTILEYHFKAHHNSEYAMTRNNLT